MSVAVLGCGRSGSNITTEMLRGSPDLRASKGEEDKKLMKRHTTYPANYLAKCDTHYFNAEDILQTAAANPKMHVAWTIRDPRDMAMSKLRRGVPLKNGGDCSSLADDATYEGCLADIRKMAKLYKVVCDYFGSRVVLVKMEDTLRNPENQAFQLCQTFGIRFHHSMPAFYLRMRNQHKRQRYGNKIDLSQIEMWKNWQGAYNGWLVKKGFDMMALFKELQPEVESFGYG
jgi:hypothetical protein